MYIQSRGFLFGSSLFANSTIFIYGALSVQITCISPIYIFGFQQVSNGAECVLISKQFLKDHLDKTTAHRLRMKVHV